MQFEEFDNKAKEAADHHHPAYDEQAWAKMQKLLDKHLPQKEDNRKRFILFLLLFIGLGATGIFIAKKWIGDNPAPVAEQTVLKQQPAGTATAGGESKQPVQLNNESNLNNDKVSNTDDRTTGSTFINGDNNTVTHPAGTTGPVNHSDPGNKNLTGLSARTVINPAGNKIIKDDNRNNSINNKPADIKTGAVVTGKNVDPVTDNNNKDKNQQGTVTISQPLKTTTEPAVKAEPEKNTAIIKEEPAVAKQKDNKEKNRKKNNSFFFTLSAGPDVSFAGKEKLGSVKLLTGAGLGYTFNNQFTIRAGFYSGRKVYTASPESYHAPAPFYTYYPYLEKVDADCKVYEIPLSVSYNFGRGSKRNWFVSGGVSSYLMKSETYDYFYKTVPTGPTLNRKRTITNANNHYFSTLGFSGGYQKNISRNISVMVEPYVKVPLAGVGDGKVKLHSGGVLLSVAIKPFAPKKEKPVFHR